MPLDAVNIGYDYFPNYLITKLINVDRASSAFS